MFPGIRLFLAFIVCALTYREFRFSGQVENLHGNLRVAGPTMMVFCLTSDRSPWKSKSTIATIGLHQRLCFKVWEF